MAIFKLAGGKLNRLSEERLLLEKNIHKLTENNLNELFALQYVSSEFALNNLRIDTLAFDKENSALVIIEYKKDRNSSVIDQGYAYLALLVNNKAEFILEYNEKTKSNLKKENVDWSASRIIFIAPEFTAHQKAAINFKNLPIEIWEIKKFENDIVQYQRIEPLESSEKIETVSSSKLIKAVSREIKTYDLEWHLKKGSEKINSLFTKLRDKIFELGDVKEKYLQFYVGWRAGDSNINFASAHLYKSKIELFILIPDKELKDPKKWITKKPESYGWAKNLKLFKIDSEGELDYAMNLISQSYEFNKNR